MKNNLKQIQANETLLYAIMIGNSVIDNYDNQPTFKVRLPADKLLVLKQHMQLNDIFLTLIKSNEEDWYYIEPTLLIIRLIKDSIWYNQVKHINSSKISSSTFLLWISLFAYKGKNKETLLNTQNLSASAANLICRLYRRHMDTEHYPIFFRNTFYIEDITQVFIYSLRLHRPAFESLELIKLFPKDLKEYDLYHFKLLVE